LIKWLSLQNRGNMRWAAEILWSGPGYIPLCCGGKLFGN
jgi:hypothetical protein